jgi:hypothetical protein
LTVICMGPVYCYALIVGVEAAGRKGECRQGPRRHTSGFRLSRNSVGSQLGRFGACQTDEG